MSPTVVSCLVEVFRAHRITDIEVMCDLIENADRRSTADSFRREIKMIFFLLTGT